MWQDLLALNCHTETNDTSLSHEGKNTLMVVPNTVHSSALGDL